MRLQRAKSRSFLQCLAVAWMHWAQGETAKAKKLAVARRRWGAQSAEKQKARPALPSNHGASLLCEAPRSRCASPLLQTWRRARVFHKPLSCQKRGCYSER